ncbi:uncharacterized protein LOC132712146 [Pantherophis guttatus]|uniref:Uncharacterized protein LOC132712146 n=1 Tax=Pantherophis guttatus TaxID=94885 RepID=A0ABM3ZJX0_PANGU|nr:uncharacterized protein LOC132712146 [Pantherophis guttatus]
MNADSLSVKGLQKSSWGPSMQSGWGKVRGRSPEKRSIDPIQRRIPFRSPGKARRQPGRDSTRSGEAPCPPCRAAGLALGAAPPGLRLRLRPSPPGRPGAACPVPVSAGSRAEPSRAVPSEQTVDPGLVPRSSKAEKERKTTARRQTPSSWRPRSDVAGEFKKCSMARGCLCCLKYMMFLFNLIFWRLLRLLCYPSPALLPETL